MSSRPVRQSMTVHATSTIQSTEGFRCDHATHGYFLALLVGRLLRGEEYEGASDSRERFSLQNRGGLL